MTEGAVTSAGTWIVEGIASIGAHNPPYFDFVLTPLWCVPVIVQANPPTGVFVSIVPAVVTEGENVTISWGSQDADECLFEGTPIGTSGSTLFAAALSDGRTFAIDCFNMWGSTPASATLTVNPVVSQCVHHGLPQNGSLSNDSSLPDSGPGYVHFLGSDPVDTDDWGCADWTIAKIQAVGV